MGRGVEELACWCFSTKCFEIATQEGLDTRQTQMSEFMAVVQENNDALQSQIRTITEMDSLEAASRVVRSNFLSMLTKGSMSWPLSMGQCIDTLISDIRAFHQANAP